MTQARKTIKCTPRRYFSYFVVSAILLSCLVFVLVSNPMYQRMPDKCIEIRQQMETPCTLSNVIPTCMKMPRKEVSGQHLLYGQSKRVTCVWFRFPVFKGKPKDVFIISIRSGGCPGFHPTNRISGEAPTKRSRQTGHSVPASS